MALKRVTTDGDQGWLKVLDANNKEISLPECLKVDHHRRFQGRDIFTILEGTRLSQRASVVQKPDGGSWLGDPFSYLSPALVEFHPGKRMVRCLAEDVVLLEAEATIDGPDPVPEGTHILSIPDHPHECPYPDAGPNRFAWFRIGGVGTNYLHAGGVSAGCVTVTERTRWTEIYKFLIFRRGDHDLENNVGVLRMCPPDLDDWSAFFNGAYQLFINSQNVGSPMGMTFTPVGDDRLAVIGEQSRFAMTAELKIPPGPGRQGRMTGTLIDRHPGPGQPGRIDFLAHLGEYGAPSRGLLVMVTAQFKGTGRAGSAGTTIELRAIEPKERPWYHLP